MDQFDQLLEMSPEEHEQAMRDQLSRLLLMPAGPLPREDLDTASYLLILISADRAALWEYAHLSYTPNQFRYNQHLCGLMRTVLEQLPQGQRPMRAPEELLFEVLGRAVAIADNFAARAHEFDLQDGPEEPPNEIVPADPQEAQEGPVPPPAPAPEQPPRPALREADLDPAERMMRANIYNLLLALSDVNEPEDPEVRLVRAIGNDLVEVAVRRNGYQAPANEDALVAVFNDLIQQVLATNPNLHDPGQCHRCVRRLSHIIIGRAMWRLIARTSEPLPDLLIPAEPPELFGHRQLGNPLFRQQMSRYWRSLAAIPFNTWPRPNEWRPHANELLRLTALRHQTGTYTAPLTEDAIHQIHRFAMRALEAFIPPALLRARALPFASARLGQMRRNSSLVARWAQRRLRRFNARQQAGNVPQQGGNAQQA